MKSNSVYREAGKFSGVILLMGIIEFILFCVFLSFRLDILLGVVYGCAFSSLNFFYLAYSVKKSVEKGENGAKAHMAISYNVRLCLTAVMIIIAAKTDAIYFWAAIIPLFFQKIAVHIVGFINSRNSKGSENS
jgi:hypothetical protein